MPNVPVNFPWKTIVYVRFDPLIKYVFTEQGAENSSLRTNMGTQFWATLDCDAERYQQFVQYMEHVAVRPNLRLIVLLEEDGPRIVRDEQQAGVV